VNKRAAGAERAPGAGRTSGQGWAAGQGPAAVVAGASEGHTVAMLTARAVAAGSTLEEAAAGMVRRDNVTRLGTPGDVAGVVASLLSPGGEWLQGAVIDVDGGRTKGRRQRDGRGHAGGTRARTR